MSIPAPWTENDQTEFDALRNAPIEMANTSYGRFLAQQKRVAERAYQKMSDEEKVDFKRKMAEWRAPTICNLHHLASPPFS